MISLVLKFLYFVAQLVEALLAIRFIFIFVNANKDNRFVQWVYENSSAFVSPFEGVITYDANIFGFPIDVNTLIAIFFFGILGYLLLSMSRTFQSE